MQNILTNYKEVEGKKLDSNIIMAEIFSKEDVERSELTQNNTESNTPNLISSPTGTTEISQLSLDTVGVTED